MGSPDAWVGLMFQSLAVFVVLGILLQLFFCYTIQVLADKLGVRHSWMAWVPILQVVPAIRAGRGSLLHLLVWCLSAVAIGIAAALLTPILSPAVAVPLLAVWGLWGFVYFALLLWNTAVDRGLSGWLGLLCMIPLVGLLAYLYIVFHDGFLAPSRVGLVLGLVCFGLPALPAARDASRLAELGQAMVEHEGDPAALGRAVAEMHQKLEAEGGAGEAGLAELLEEMSRNLGSEGTVVPEATADGLAQRVGVPGFDPLRGFPVVQSGCPPETSPRGASPPEGFERWCELAQPEGAPVRHGGYSAWHANGRLRETGVYEHGKRQGVWTRFHPGGSKKAQAQFRDGVQHGLLLTWDEAGRKDREIWYEDGEPVGS